MIEIRISYDENLRRTVGGTSEDSMVVSYDSGQLTGYCIYRIEEDRIQVRDMREESGDIEIVDGMIRLIVKMESLPVVCHDRGLSQAWYTYRQAKPGDTIDIETILHKKCRD